MVSRVIPVEPFDLVIFGGTGDLARRKILPALFRRYCDGQLEGGGRVIGAARTDMDADAYRQFVREAIVEFVTDQRCEPDRSRCVQLRPPGPGCARKGRDQA